MRWSNIFIRQFILILFAQSIILACANHKQKDLIKVLILSGKNNHEWQKTTPVLIKMYRASRLFTINVTEKPETLTYNQLNKYDVIVSNWNSWPDNNFRMTKKWEHDFRKYIKKGGGALFIHAGASSFYSWEEYHQIGIGRWGKETNHGEQTTGKVYGFDQTHPVTKGIRDFYIVDEIWEKTDIYPKAKALAFVSATDSKDGHLINEPSVFENQYGKGRSMYTILGHNERALLNTGLQALLLRATEWIANGKVTLELPADLKKSQIPPGNQFNWQQTDTTLSLTNNSEIVWQYNFRNRFGKSYFHPVRINNSTLTCVSPPDHPWHLGLWFSLKFINGVNYWEYLDDFRSEETGYRSAGITEIQKIELFKNPDFSADLRVELQYRPADGKAVMTEKRNIHISPPLDDGNYFMDQEYIFNPLEDIVLDRTPVEGEPEGKSWGGYAGLSLRFNQDYTSPKIIVPTKRENYKNDNWLYMGFNTLTGETAGICILQNPNYTTPSTRWYVINDPGIPFYYYSPAVLFNGRIILKRGERLHLKYRVWILTGNISKESLQAKYNEYLNSESQLNKYEL
jgi:type 1 glutamine amidotransferase